MPTLVELPKELVKNALDGAAALSDRRSKAATNSIIKEAHEKEVAAYLTAAATLKETK